MDTEQLGRHYDQIAQWQADKRKNNPQGVDYVNRAIQYTKAKTKALDVGCGSGGPIMSALLSAGFRPIGIDASSEMLRIAQDRHPEAEFVHTPFLKWKSEEQFDLVVAWDSTFHAPSTMQQPIVEKLCRHLAPGGVLVFTGSDDTDDIVGEDMNGVGFEYGSLDYREYLQIVEDSGCDFIMMERDQMPCLGHVVYMCTRRNG